MWFSFQNEQGTCNFNDMLQEITKFFNHLTINHHLTIMLFGKSAKPRAFKDINVNILVVYYRNKKKAWMDADPFKERFHNMHTMNCWFEHCS